MARRVFRRCFPLVLALWILFVLYPNPLNLAISIHRAVNFDAEPAAVQSMLTDFPSDPVDIEKAVLARISYRYDWALYGMPWYVPTVEQVLERSEGDCKARALVLASILEAKNISYEIHASPTHTWVHYETKLETLTENAEVQWYRYDPGTGETRLQIPQIGLSKVVDSFWRAFWDPMPDGRKVLLILGLSGLIVARVFSSRRERSVQMT
jgi:hypothetical protein